MSSPKRIINVAANGQLENHPKRTREPSSSRSASLGSKSPNNDTIRRSRTSTPENSTRRRHQTSSSRSSSPQSSPNRTSNRKPHNKKNRRVNLSGSASPRRRNMKSNDEVRNSSKPPVDFVEKASEISINLLGKTGGAYIPPARLRQMQAKITDKSSEPYQRIAWEALKKSIHGLINKVNVSNIAQVVKQLLLENIVRGRGLLVRSLLTSQAASPTFTHVFAALIAVVNTKLPQIGELLLKRLINEFVKAFRRNQKERCLTSARFLAHLVNQKVAHELIVLELLTLLLEQTTDDSVEVSVATLKECGAFLSKVVPKGVAGIFDHLRRILNDSQCDKRISYMIEVLFQIRRDGWKDHPTVLPELDLINEDDQITHTLSLLDPADPDDGLNIFRLDSDFESNEAKYAAIRASFLEDESDDDKTGSGSDSDSEGDGEDVQGPPGEQEGGGVIIDQTETNLVHLRRTIYLMLQSSISADEGAHRLLQLKIKPGEEYEVASMVLDCCAQTRSYETRYGRLAQRLCRVILFSGDRPKPGEEKQQSKATDPTEPPRTYVSQFEKIFGEQYVAVHRLETPKLKNVAFFFAHLLYTDSISWGVLECVRLNERDTSSSGRIFLKYLFQELCSYLGLGKLQDRLRDETLQPFFTHLLPRDNPKDTRFAINFLTTIGLGGLTLDLREHLQAVKAIGEKARLVEAIAQLHSSSSSSGSDSSSSGSSTDSHSSSSSDDSGDNRKSKKKLQKKPAAEAPSEKRLKGTDSHNPRRREPSPFKETAESLVRGRGSRQEPALEVDRNEKAYQQGEGKRLCRLPPSPNAEIFHSSPPPQIRRNARALPSDHTAPRSRSPFPTKLHQLSPSSGKEAGRKRKASPSHCARRDRGHRVIPTPSSPVRKRGRQASSPRRRSPSPVRRHREQSSPGSDDHGLRVSNVEMESVVSLVPDRNRSKHLNSPPPPPRLRGRQASPIPERRNRLSPAFVHHSSGRKTSPVNAKYRCDESVESPVLQSESKRRSTVPTTPSPVRGHRAARLPSPRDRKASPVEKRRRRPSPVTAIESSGRKLSPIGQRRRRPTPSPPPHLSNRKTSPHARPKMRRNESPRGNIESDGSPPSTKAMRNRRVTAPSLPHHRRNSPPPEKRRHTKEGSPIGRRPRHGGHRQNRRDGNSPPADEKETTKRAGRSWNRSPPPSCDIPAISRSSRRNDRSPCSPG